ncbi:MAG: sigma-E processing peptidase SpoIIGA [Clostridia bacterium]|nr:sigma-E processing peptidase SpoIIGA [Clostridia bacterium]
MSMYIELFILDNMVFNMLILRIASALSGRRFSRIGAFFVCAFQTVYSAFAVNRYIMRFLPFKLLLCFLFALPFFVADRKVTLAPVMYVLLSTVICGGTVYMLNGGSVYSGNWLRLILYPALMLFSLPALLRRLKKKRHIERNTTEIKFVFSGTEYIKEGIYDSGNLLTEPVSGLPVIVLYAPELKKHAKLPLICSDMSSSGNLIHALRPEKLLIDGIPFDMLIAPTDKNPHMKALVPVMHDEISAA